ncbi:MAG: WbqC family protein [Nitrospirae bacterium]|nr:WbqC family protein [Nitrospirota bacterium]
MRVTLHQLNFLPPLSFFAKWDSSDCLVAMDQLQFVHAAGKYHYANRCKLGDDKWCTVPVVQVFPQSICDAQIVANWRPRSVIDRIKNDYRKAPYVSRVQEGIGEAIQTFQDSRRLSELNFLLLAWAARELGIRKPIYLQSELGLPEETDRDVRIVKTVRAVGGNIFVAGPSWSTYMNPAAYRDDGIKVEVSHYDMEPYDRGLRPWVPYMSVVDACCYQGDNAARFINTRLEEWNL